MSRAPRAGWQTLQADQARNVFYTAIGIFFTDQGNREKFQDQYNKYQKWTYPPPRENVMGGSHETSNILRV